MQKLTYINLDGERAEFCGAPYVLARISGLGLPDVDVYSIRGAYQQGETPVYCRRRKRMLTVKLHIMAGTRVELYRRRMELMRILSPDRAMRGGERAMLLYENDYGRYITHAIPDGGLDAQGRTLNAQPNVQLTFRCESPYWYDKAESGITFSYTGDGLTFPFQFPVGYGMRDYAKTAKNHGQAAAPVEVRIACRGETPRLYNQTTGKRLSMSAPIPGGYTLILNTDPARLDARMIDQSGLEQSAFGRLSLDTPLAEFTLAPGDNVLIYEPGGAGAQSEITVTWRNAFEGV